MPDGSPLPDLSGLTVLVVEDHEDSATMLTETLWACGAIAVSAPEARTAVGYLRAVKIDVLITDLAMPQHDGYWLAAQARKITDGRPLVIVAVTGRDTPDEERMAKFDIAAHVVKPVDPFGVAGLIVKLVRS